MGTFISPQLFPCQSRFFKKSKKQQPLEIEEGYADWVKERYPPWLKKLAVVVLILMIGAGLTYWKRAAFKRYAVEWTADRHLAKAEEALNTGNGSVAVRRAITSLELEPNKIDTYRVLLAAARISGDSRILVISQTVFLHPESTLEDRGNALAAIVDVGDGRRFQRLYRQLSKEDVLDPAIHHQWLRSRLVLNLPAELLADLDPTATAADPDLAFLQVRALYQLGTSEGDTEAGEVVLRLLSGGSSDSETAVEPALRVKLLDLLALLPHSRIQPETAANLQKALEKDFAAMPKTLNPTLPFTLRLAATPERRETIIDAAVASLGETAGLEALCLWLERLRESTRILDTLESLEHPTNSTVVYMSHLRALTIVGRFEDALNLLKFPVENSDRVQLAVIKARICRKLDRKSDETTAWRSAMLEAERDLTQNHFIRLAAMAQQSGNAPVAADALVAACRNRIGILPSIEDTQWVIKYLYQNDRAEDLFSVTSRMLSVDRQNPVLLNNAIYLNLITSMGKAKVGEMIPVAEALVRDAPQYPHTRRTLALVYAVADRAEDALAIYRPEERTAFGLQEMSASARVGYALVLAENGEISEFQKVAAMINWTELSSSERRFFEERLQPYLGACPRIDFF